MIKQQSSHRDILLHNYMKLCYLWTHAKHNTAVHASIQHTGYI